MDIKVEAGETTVNYFENLSMPKQCEMQVGDMLKRPVCEVSRYQVDRVFNYGIYFKKSEAAGVRELVIRRWNKIDETDTNRGVLVTDWSARVNGEDLKMMSRTDEYDEGLTGDPQKDAYSERGWVVGTGKFSTSEQDLLFLRYADTVVKFCGGDQEKITQAMELAKQAMGKADLAQILKDNLSVVFPKKSGVQV